MFDAQTAEPQQRDGDWAGAWLRSGATAGFGAYQLAARTENELSFSSVPGSPPETAFSRVVAERVQTRAEGIAYLRAPAPAYVPGLRCDEAVRAKAEGVPLAVSRGGHTSLEINYNRPPFDDRRVRQALSYATPYRDVLDRGFLGMALPWQSPLPSFDLWPRGGRWPYETAISTARDLIKQAGYSGGIEAPLYLPDRPDAARIGELLQAAYAQIGVAVNLRPMAEVPPGWIPPLYLRLECGHNFGEPVYDLAHDYVAINNLGPGAPYKDGIGTWFPKYPGSRAYETAYARILAAPSSAERKRLCLRMQQQVVQSATSVYLAENLQISAFTPAAETWARDYSQRAVLAFQFQNCNTGYLPDH
jgi:peptide/nickel transport system substrate-binding protein